MYPYIVYNIHLIADNKRYTYSYVIYIVHFDKFIHSVFRTNCRHGFHFISRRFSSSLGHSVHVTFSLHIGRSFFPTKHSIMPILGIFGPCPEFQCIPRILTAFLDHQSIHRLIFRSQQTSFQLPDQIFNLKSGHTCSKQLEVEAKLSFMFMLIGVQHLSTMIFQYYHLLCFFSVKDSLTGCWIIILGPRK